MRERRTAQESRRAQEFESFVAGAAGRLLHVATLLTGEPLTGPAPAAEELLTCALSRTYAVWDRLRGEDPYAARPAGNGRPLRAAPPGATAGHAAASWTGCPRRSA